MITAGYYDSKGLFRSFIYAVGTFVPINVPGAVPPKMSGPTPGPTGINDAGVIVGGYYKASGLENGFSLTPRH